MSSLTDLRDAVTHPRRPPSAGPSPGRFYTYLGWTHCRTLRPMRGLKRLRCARVISAGHAFIQNLRRGYYELGVEEPTTLRVAAAFTELALAI